MILGFKVGYKTDICGLSSETSSRERLNTSFKGRTNSYVMHLDVLGKHQMNITNFVKTTVALNWQKYLLHIL